jgi:NHL repeat
MSAILGSGDFTYRVEERDWAKLPGGWVIGDVAAVAVDRYDRVYLFNRGPHPMTILDSEGNFVNSWGEGIFKNPHGLHIGPDDCIYCTDDGDHTVRKCTLDGRVLMTLGVPGKPAPHMSGRPFHRCTHTALSPENDLYVSDGYGNARIHKYSPEGKLLLSWGEPGIGPGQFNLPHNICCDGDGWVYVADRENHRIQVFDGNGKYETQINNFHRPSALMLSGRRCPICYIGEIGPYMNVNRNTPNLGPRISIATHEGKLLGRLERFPSAGIKSGQFLSRHGLAVDSKGNLYVGEVGTRAWPSLFPGQPVRDNLQRFHRLTKIEDPGEAARRQSLEETSLENEPAV